MTPATFTVAESLDIQSVIRQMVELNVHHLFVTDETGIVIGMIEALDVLKRLM
jgi:predicted transcriptional regulator